MMPESSLSLDNIPYFPTMSDTEMIVELLFSSPLSSFSDYTMFLVVSLWISISAES